MIRMESVNIGETIIYKGKSYIVEDHSIIGGVTYIDLVDSENCRINIKLSDYLKDINGEDNDCIPYEVDTEYLMDGESFIVLDNKSGVFKNSYNMKHLETGLVFYPSHELIKELDTYPAPSTWACIEKNKILNEIVRKRDDLEKEEMKPKQVKNKYTEIATNNKELTIIDDASIVSDMLVPDMVYIKKEDFIYATKKGDIVSVYIHNPMITVPKIDCKDFTLL